ncbi:MAG: hypothetical protein V3574_00705 [Candidatus Moraniibacteriota bacterium]
MITNMTTGGRLKIINKINNVKIARRHAAIERNENKTTIPAQIKIVIKKLFSIISPPVE